MALANYVISLERVRGHIGFSVQATYIFKYLKNRGARTVIIEENYVDKDYVIDYSGFYARSFEKIDKCTTRLHFFSKRFSKVSFENLLRQGKDGDTSKLGEYLGFAIIKHFKDEDGNPNLLIGRTALSPMPSEIGTSSDSREYIWIKNYVNLYGIPFEVFSLPFQAQDHAVAACATISLWIANAKLNDLFQTPSLSPLEVTNRAISFIDKERNLPSEGLALEQMLTFVKSVNLDYDIINIQSIRDVADSDEFSEDVRDWHRKKLENIVPDTVKAFILAKMPIIAGISLSKFDSSLLVEKGYHAVVISGFRHNQEGEINRLYIHDDQIGPYCRVTSTDGRFLNSADRSFLKWENEWIQGPDSPYDEMLLDILVIPSYPKIRYSYNKIYDYFLEKKVQNLDEKFTLQLINVQEYKARLFNSNIDNKVDFLRKPLPRFLWLIGLLENNHIVWEEIYDATSHYSRKVGEIFYFI